MERKLQCHLTIVEKHRKQHSTGFKPAHDYYKSNVQQRWDSLRDVSHSIALRAFGRRRKITQDWFEASVKEFNTPIEEKYAALLK